MIGPRTCSAVLVVLLVRSFLLAGAWETFRGESLRSGNPTGAPLPRKLAVRWTYRCDDCAATRIDASPAIAGDAVVAALSERSAFSATGRVVCLDAPTGTLRWSTKTSHPVFSSPAVSGGRVFVGEGYHENVDCRLRCLDLEDGSEIWSFQTRSHIESSPTVGDGRVWFGAGDDGVYCLDASDGKKLWQFEGDHVDVSPLVSSGLLFTGVGYGDVGALCLDAQSGELRWRTPVDLPVWGSPVRVGNRVYFGCGTGNLLESAPAPRGAVLCLAAASGGEVWRADLPDAVLTAIAYADGTLFAGSRDGHLYALDPRSGNELWRQDLGSPLVSSPLAGEKLVGAIGSGGRFILAALKTGEVVGTFELGKLLGDGETVISSPAAAPGLVVAAAGAVIIGLGEGGGDAGRVAKGQPEASGASGAAASRIDVDREAGTVTIDAVTAKQGVYDELKGAIEYVLVAKGGKDYETLFVTDSAPEDLAAAFRGLGDASGRPAEDGSAPRGMQFEIFAEYEANGQRLRREIAAFMRHSQDGSPVEAATWTLTGSKEALDPSTGQRGLQCFSTKSIVGLHYTDPSPLLQNARPEARTENIYRSAVDELPAAGTPVRLVFKHAVPPAGTRRLRVLVSGRVQGVGYRAFTQREAKRVELVGWVRNLADGRVEAVLEGQQDAIDRLLVRMQTGPRGANVTKLESAEETALGDFDEFTIDD